MRYNGSFMQNFEGAVKSGDADFTQDLVLDEVATLIKERPFVLSETLRASNIQVSKSPSKKELINKVSDNLYSNTRFQNNLAKVVASKNVDASDYNNANGEWWSKVKGWFSKSDSSEPNLKGDTNDAALPKTSGGGVNIGADPLSAIAGAIGAVFSFASISQQKKVEQEKAKATLYEKVFSNSQAQRSWIPVVIITGVLLIGGIVAYATLKKD